ncbi:Hypothetical predicted protein [Paramuricea clavata]|uniref:Uncharacterized protein n=1 Tax=Paramuricea clavata TaxID=317549 RepID=A0A6S7HK59_PARCT|nr:Hypothetical predicted protein [Paramuricea clavata]
MSKANKQLGVLKRTCLSSKNVIRRSLYLTLVKSQLSYATQVWSSNHHSQLNRRIERVQKRRATKWILGIKTGEIPYEQRLMTLKLLPLTYDREIKDLVFFYKMLYGHINLKMDSYVSFIEHRCTRLSQAASVVLQTPLHRTTTFQ